MGAPLQIEPAGFATQRPAMSGAEPCAGSKSAGWRPVGSRLALGADPMPPRGGASRRRLIAVAEASLRRLGTECLDLYQLHRPDPAVPMLETLQALDDLVRAGMTRHVGHSTLAAWQMVDAWWISWTEHLVRPVSVQLPFNLLRREVALEALPACRAKRARAGAALATHRRLPCRQVPAGRCANGWEVVLEPRCPRDPDSVKLRHLGTPSRLFGGQRPLADRTRDRLTAQP